MFVLISVQSLSATIFIEENGLVLMEVESIPLVAPWQSKTDIAGYSGTAYYLGTANFFGVGGNHVLNYKISIKTAGLYQLNIRSRIAEGTSSTDHNDHFVRMLSGDTKVLAPAPNDNHATGTWYKFYQNKLNIWTWQTSNKDNDPRSLSWNLTPGVYWIQISMRSKGCAIDKIALWNKAKHALANAATGNSTVAQNNALNALALSQIEIDPNPLPTDPSDVLPDLVSRRFDKTKDILIAQFDNKPDADDIHSQAALASILAHSDGEGVNVFAVAGAYGSQTGKYINSNSLFTMAYGVQNVNWTDAHNDRANSVTRIVSKVKPILEAGGWAWVQEAGQSDITNDWIVALINSGISPATIKSNVIVVQHSKWNENATTTAKLTYVKNMTTYASIDDGNENFGVYTADRPKRQFPTPGYETTQTNFIIEAMNEINPNTKVRDLWREADKIIKESGFNANWSAITKGGVDFSDCVENWYILDLGDNANTIRKFWDRYVVNDPGISSNLDFAVATQKNFKISQISNGNYEAENPFSDPFSIKIINMNGQVIKEEKGINQAVYNFSITANTSVIAIFMVSNGLRTYSQKIVIQ